MGYERSKPKICVYTNPLIYLSFDADFMGDNRSGFAEYWVIMTKKKVCLEDSQVKRLAGDAYRMGKGQTEGICDTVKEIVEEAVPREERIGKSKKASKKKETDEIEKWLNRRIKSVIDKITGDFF